MGKRRKKQAIGTNGVVKEGKAATTDPYSWGVNVSDQDASSLGDGGELLGGANSTTMMKSQIPSFVVHKYDGFRNENRNNKIINKSEIIRLNLEIGLLGESKSDDLDLELRLGVS
ncbi:hypothetical protein OSB04_029614 [Centaurea solstitialis]|uniref:Uncharacterized protein n=1 Tax=Centaurea solstitialis TaxID=347529 RepID=A0AA38SJ13_9ASTR|nr:hypothetical protein OSB04_029614 [Centaurea solstitialis]